MKLPILIALALFTVSATTSTLVSAAQRSNTVKCGDEKDDKKEDKS